uniref:hypothetical protein n=1 Tax=Paraburkholderia strydomiana TaxID=1245417 RepID=UPI0038B98532
MQSQQSERRHVMARVKTSGWCLDTARSREAALRRRETNATGFQAFSADVDPDPGQPRRLVTLSGRAAPDGNTQNAI